MPAAVHRLAWPRHSCPPAHRVPHLDHRPACTQAACQHDTWQNRCCCMLQQKPAAAHPGGNAGAALLALRQNGRKCMHGQLPACSVVIAGDGATHGLSLCSCRCSATLDSSRAAQSGEVALVSVFLREHRATATIGVAFASGPAGPHRRTATGAPDRVQLAAPMLPCDPWPCVLSSEACSATVSLIAAPAQGPGPTATLFRPFRRYSGAMSVAGLLENGAAYTSYPLPGRQHHGR